MYFFVSRSRLACSAATIWRSFRRKNTCLKSFLTETLRFDRLTWHSIIVLKTEFSTSDAV